MSIHTVYKIGHWRGDSLIWTPKQGEIPLGEVLRGSAAAEAIMGQEDFLYNALTDGGEEAILESFFRNNHTPTFYLGLWNDGAIAETDTIASLTSEVSGTGYARISVARNTTDWGATGLDSGDHKTTSVNKVFTAGGAWTAAQDLVLVSPSSGTSGTLYAWVALSTSRTLANTDTLTVNMGVKLA